MKVLEQLDEVKREHWEKKSEQIRQKNNENPKRKIKKSKGWHRMIHTSGGTMDPQGRIFDRKSYLFDEQEQLLHELQLKSKVQQNKEGQ